MDSRISFENALWDEPNNEKLEAPAGPREAVDAIWESAAKLRDGNPTAASESDARTAKQKGWQAPEFSNPQPAAYLLLLLELGLGLRRNEADKAQWDWFITDAKGRHFFHVRPSAYFTPKSREARTIPVQKELFDAIHAARGDSVSPFIVPGLLPKRYAAGQEPKNLVYRCDRHHRTLAFWLRTKHGIADQKPCHLLRKEFGSYVATSFGLFHAQSFLGHSSPAVTEAYYAGLTDLPELNHVKISA